MVFKDIVVNYSKDSKQRMAFVVEKLNTLEDGERIIFVGDTFYTNDLNLSYFVEFINILNQYEDHKVYIQDVESLSAKMMNTEVKSWYSLPSWPKHVSLYLSTEDIEASSTELKNAFSFTSINKEQEKEEEKHLFNGDLIIDFNEIALEEVLIGQDNLLLEHEEDLIASFIQEVRAMKYAKEKEASIIQIGIEALLRR